MLLWQHQLLESSIVSLQTGGKLGTITEPIIDPKNLKIEAFYCEGPLIQEEKAILYSVDIREYGELGALVNDADDIMPLDDDLVRLKELTDKDFQLIGKKIVTEHNQKLGKVNGYTIETNSFLVIKLQVKKPFLKGFNENIFLIDRTQIRKITNDTIIVAEAVVKVTEAASTSAPIPREAIENPFRKPMPETTDRS